MASYTKANTTKHSYHEVVSAQLRNHICELRLHATLHAMPNDMHRAYALAKTETRHQYDMAKHTVQLLECYRQTTQRAIGCVNAQHHHTRYMLPQQYKLARLQNTAAQTHH